MVQDCNARVRVEEDACLEWLPVSVKMRRKSHWIGVTYYIPIMRTVPTRVAGIHLAPNLTMSQRYLARGGRIMVGRMAKPAVSKRASRSQAGIDNAVAGHELKPRTPV